MTEAIFMRHVNGKYIRESDTNHHNRLEAIRVAPWTTPKYIPSDRLRLSLFILRTGMFLGHCCFKKQWNGR